MPEDAVKVRGWPELAAGTEQLAGNIDRETQARFRGAAATIAGRVRSVVPRLSGAMAGSVGVQPDAPVGVGYLGGVPYAGWVDFGGGHGRPYVGSGRYLYPTVHDSEQLVEDAARQAATTETKGMRWPTPR